MCEYIGVMGVCVVREREGMCVCSYKCTRARVRVREREKERMNE